MSINKIINAKYISIEDDGYVEAIGFADNCEEPTEFVVIQKSHSYDDQDRILGMDKVHFQIECSEISASFYGGVDEIVSSGRSITFVFSNSRKKSFGIDADIKIAVDKSCLNFDDALVAVSRMLNGEAGFRVNFS